MFTKSKNFPPRMEDFSKSNNLSMANMGGLSIIQEFSMKSCALTRVDHAMNNVVQTGCTDGNQGAPVNLNKVIRLVEILKQCKKLFTRKEFKNLLKHRAVRSSLSDIADLYNKGRISLEKNSINCITSFLRLIKKKENSHKKNRSNGETTKNKLELKLSVMIADLKMKSTSRDLIPRGGRTPTSSKRQESSSQTSISTRNITGRKPRRKSLSKSESRSRSRSPLLRKNLFPRRDRSRPSSLTKRKNSYSRYRRSGSWSPLSSSRSRSRSRSHSPSRKRDYFDSRESRSRFRDHPFKYYYEESSSSKRPPHSRRPKSPAGLNREKIYPNRRSRRSRSPSMASLKREVDKLRIENRTALKDLRELLAHNYSSSSSTTHDVGVPSNPYSSYLPTRNDFLAQYGATVEDQCFSVSETSLQTQSNCQNSYQIEQKGSNQYPGPSMSSYSPPNNEFLPESAGQISLSKQSRIMHEPSPSLSPPDLSPVPLHLPFSDVLTYPFPSTDTLVTPSISPLPPSSLNEFTSLRISESSNEPVLNEPSTEQRFSKEIENVENIEAQVKCCEVERIKHPRERVNVVNPASNLESLSNEIEKHVNISSVNKMSLETSTGDNDTVNSSEQTNEIDPSYIENSKREKVSKTDESAVCIFDNKKHRKVDEIEGELCESRKPRLTHLNKGTAANLEKCTTSPSSCEQSIQKSGQNDRDLGMVVKEMFPSLIISEESTMHPNSNVSRQLRSNGGKTCTPPIIPEVGRRTNCVFMYKIPSLKFSKVNDNIWKIVQHKPSDQSEQETAGFISFSEEELNTHEESDTANIKEVLSVTSPELFASSMFDKMDASRENVKEQSSELDSNFGTVSFNENEQNLPRERFHERSTRNMMQEFFGNDFSKIKIPVGVTLKKCSVPLEKTSTLPLKGKGSVMHKFYNLTSKSVSTKTGESIHHSSTVTPALSDFDSIKRSKNAKLPTTLLYEAENTHLNNEPEISSKKLKNFSLLPENQQQPSDQVPLEMTESLSFLNEAETNFHTESDATVMSEVSKFARVPTLLVALKRGKGDLSRENVEKQSPDVMHDFGTNVSIKNEQSSPSENLNRKLIRELYGSGFSNIQIPSGVALKRCMVTLGRKSNLPCPTGKRSIMPPNMYKESPAASVNEFLSNGLTKLSTAASGLERKVLPCENEEKRSPKVTVTLDTIASNESEDSGRLSASNQSQEKLNRDMIIEFNGIAFSNVKVPKGVILKKCMISLRRTSIASPSGK